MPRKEQPKFRVGDVVEVTAEGRCAIKGAKGSITGVKEVKDTDYEDAELQGLPEGEFYLYDFVWFEHPKDVEDGLDSGFRLCKGMSNKQLCDPCEYFYKCPESPFASICKTNGKLDAQLCDECKYRFKCWTTK
jgi:hypothetical protein